LRPQSESSVSPSSPSSPSSTPNRPVPASVSAPIAGPPPSGAVDATSATAPVRPAPVPAGTAAPAVFLTDPGTIAAQRAAYQAGAASVSVPVTLLIKRATRDLAVTPVSVMSKSQLPPSGTKHDYLSLSVYAWPNPHSTTGMPYVIRDGDRNPAVASVSDKTNLVNVIDWSQELAYAYYFTGNQAYAAKATTIISTWFLDPATRMNPNLKYAQGVPGSSSGQAGGIIDAADLPQVVDAAGLLAGSAAWTAADAAALHSWFADYLSWLLTSSNGKAEAATANNHATWYADQVISYELFAGHADLAKATVGRAETTIIRAQITSTGAQPRELARSNSWSYSTYNLDALARLAQLAASVHIELWHYTTSTGASIRGALAFVLAHESHWTYAQASAMSSQYLVYPLYAAAAAYASGTYAKDAVAAAATLPAAYPALALMYPET
jgi:hypothetical protein